MPKYIVTSICGDTYNISTYDIISCEEKDLIQAIKRKVEGFSWDCDSLKDYYKIFQVSEIDKEALREKYNPTEFEKDFKRVVSELEVAE